MFLHWVVADSSDTTICYYLIFQFFQGLRIEAKSGQFEREATGNKLHLREVKVSYFKALAHR